MIGTSSIGRYGAEPIFSVTAATVDNFADIYLNESSFGPWPVRLYHDANFTHRGGTIYGGIYLNTSGEKNVAVTGGQVEFITNYDGGDGSTIAVSGGMVGDSALAGIAIYNNVADCDIIISGGTVVSANASSDSGTIANSGRLAISGGKVINVGFGEHRVALLNGIADTDTAAAVTISGTAEIYSSKKGRHSSINNFGVINNARGSMVISGGKVYSGGDTVYTVIANRNNAKLVITGSAEIKSEAGSLEYVVSNTSVLAARDSSAVALEISGGKIIAANSGMAVYGRNSKTSISGTAELTSPDAYSVVYMFSGAQLFLLGGTVTSKSSEDVKTAIFAFSGGRAGSAGRITMGGSPTLTGCIRYDGEDPYGKAITILTAGPSAFSPGGKKYNLFMNIRDSGVVLTNGARFTTSFTLDTLAIGSSLRLAASGNDAIVTSGRIWNVSFNLNGSTSATAPVTIPVINGGTIGELSKPSTDPYFITKSDGKKYRNDGEWHRHNGTVGDQINVGDVFVFGLGLDGDPITQNTTLTLLWTDSTLSVLKSDREIPVAQSPAVTAIAPIAVTAGELIAGPNPSAKRAGKVAFFWNGAALKGGTLQVYDAAGNAVSRVLINDTGVSGKRQIAAWNLTDAKGRSAADGAYIAKGVIKTKSGKSERVSVVLGVR